MPWVPLALIIDDMSNDRFGVYRAVVTDNLDPMLRERVRIELPADAGGQTPWAAVARPVTSVVQESPAVGTQVLVAFEGGDPNLPYVIGALWQEPAPAVRTLALRSGQQVVIDEAAQTVRVLNPEGTELVLESNGALTITASAVNVHADVTTFSGVVSCTTLAASSGVISPAYTPGLGNTM